MTLQWSEATAAIDNAPSILLVTHLHPDGDAIGSLLGLANALRERGKQVVAAVDDGVPDYLRFLPGADTVVSTLKEGEWPLMISLDSSDEERTGDVGKYGRARSAMVMNIDHHPTNTMFGQVHLIKPEAVSTTEILQEWLSFMEQRISRDVAIPLLTGLVTDTIAFRTSNVTAYTLKLAQHLMERGASLTEIVQRTINSTPYSTVALWRESLQTVELQDGVISANITLQMLKDLGLTEPTDAGLIGFMNTVDESRVAVVFKEKPDQSVEVSLRCKPGYDVSEVAFKLGGGGHKQASGATVRGTLEEVRARVLPMLFEVVRQGELVIE